MVQSLWKIVWRFLKKLKTELPYNAAIPLLGIYPKEMKILIWKDTCTPVLIAALFTIAKIRKHLSVHQQMNRYRRYGTYILWNITQLLKRMK